MALVSHPLVVLASAQRCLPASDLGPVDLPPWIRHTLLPCMAGEPHWCLVRFDMAWHRGHVILPPASVMYCSWGVMSIALISTAPLDLMCRFRTVKVQAVCVIGTLGGVCTGTLYICITYNWYNSGSARAVQIRQLYQLYQLYVI